MTVDGWVEAQTALVGADGGVVLDAIAAVDADGSLVIHPWHTEDDDAFRFRQAFQNRVFLVFGVPFQNGFQGGQHLFHCLDEFRLVAVFFLHTGKDTFNVVAQGLVLLCKLLSKGLYNIMHKCKKGNSFDLN